jgi:outer membrane receptor for ferrienterochelin and colicins
MVGSLMVYFATQPKALGGLISSLVFLLGASFALAQDAEGENSTIVYAADYFAQFAPINAQDMLDRIPGQDSSAPGRGGPVPGGNPSSGGRGLGSGSGGSQILINGKRIAGKNNQASEQLSRISADQVREIQIIRGTSGELDVRGSGQVVNVILFAELPSTSISYEISAQHYQNDHVEPGGNVAISGQNGGFNYLFSGTSSPRYRNSIARENSVLGDFSLNDIVLEEFVVDQVQNEMSMNLGYELSDTSSIRFNALYGQSDNPTTVNRYTTDLTRTPNPLTIEREDIPGLRDNWEIGGDYEVSFNNGHKFKLLAIANQNNQEIFRQRFLTQPDGSEQLNLFLNPGSTIEEQIVRGAYTMGIFDGQDIEFGVERALTTLDSNLALGLLTGTNPPSAALGGLIPQNITNANSTVEELRYEPFVIHNWKINEKLSLESTLVYESSEISQSGDVTNQRDFAFIKPKIDARYNITPLLQVRGSIEKIVNQLSFADFVAANDDQDNDANTLGGNAELRQQTQVRYQLNAEYRIPNDVGVLNAELFYADHEDVIDRVDASTSEANLNSANGNIGDGTEYGLDLSASIRMKMINLPNLLINTTLSVQDSNVTDPFLGIERRFQFYQRGRFTTTFQHFIPSLRVNWGMQYFDRIDGGMFQYEVNDIEFIVGEPRVNFFAEYVTSRSVTYRFDFGNITDSSQCRRRTRFVGRTSANILEEIEWRCTDGGNEFSLSVNGTF